MANNKKKEQPKAVEQEVQEEAVETTVETEEAEAPAEAAEAAEAKEAKPKMYVGPTLIGVARQNAVYTEIPEGAAELIKKDPEIGNLFIDVEDYGKANKMLREGTGYIFSAFQKALQIKNNK